MKTRSLARVCHTIATWLSQNSGLGPRIPRAVLFGTHVQTSDLAIRNGDTRGSYPMSGSLTCLMCAWPRAEV